MRFHTEQSHLGYPWRNLRCHVFPLAPLERLRWRIKQRLFEFCVGHHWSYSNGKADRRWQGYPHGKALGWLYYHLLNRL
jgi:hypothetical protein